MNLLQKTAQKKNIKKISTEFGDFVFLNNHVYLLKTYEKSRYLTLIDNDQKFFKQIIRNMERTNFSSTEYFFPLTKHDWNVIRKSVFFILLTITGKCNSNCNICFMSERVKCREMNEKNVKQILSKVGKGKAILLFGGEPTMNKSLFKIIDAIQESGNYPEVFTNGLMLAQPNYTKRLKRKGIKRVYISFDGFRENIYEKLRGDKNQLYMKLKALYNLKKYDINTIISFTLVSGLNEDQLLPLLKFAIKNGFVKGIVLNGATSYYGKFDIEMNKFLTTSDIIRLLENISNNKIKMGYFLEFYRLRENINKLLNKVGLVFPRGSTNTPFKVNTSKFQIEEYIPLGDLKKINEAIEKRKFLSILKYMWKYRVFRHLNPVKNYYKSFRHNAFWINPGIINVPLNNFYRTYNTITIEMSIESDTQMIAYPAFT